MPSTTDPLVRTGTKLRGLTWDHPRGLDPLVSASTAWAERGGVGVEWTTRSLSDFGENRSPASSAEFDLVVVDHPQIGTLASAEELLPLTGPLWDHVRSHPSLGRSVESYMWKEDLWAVPIDAAAQGAVTNPQATRGCVPRTWDDVFSLDDQLRIRGLSIGVAGYPPDCMNSFLSICASMGAEPHRGQRGPLSAAVGRIALQVLRRLHRAGGRQAALMTPIDVYRRMAEGEVAYAPLLFGYVNMSDDWEFGPPPQVDSTTPGRGVLGGAGIAISATSTRVTDCLEFIRFVSLPAIQSGLYTQAGGQPASLAAWRLHSQSSRFFAQHCGVVENAYVRPNHPGFVRQHRLCGEVLHDYLYGDASAHSAARDELVLSKMDELIAEAAQDEQR